MPNEMSFEVQFTRAQIEELLQDPNVSLVMFSGKYEYAPLPENGSNWNMTASVHGVSDTFIETNPASRKQGCPTPCPVVGTI